MIRLFLTANMSSSMDIDDQAEASQSSYICSTVVEYSSRSFGVMGRCDSWRSTLDFARTSHRLQLPNQPLFFCYRDDVISFLDGIENRVEALRKEAHKLQEQRDHLHATIDMLKNTDFLSNLNEADKEEVNLTLQRINERLQVGWMVLLDLMNL